MKLNYKITAAVAAIALGAIATQSMADAFADQVVADLQAQGYSVVEVELGPNQVKAEAIMGDTKIELVYDRATGEVLSREEEKADAEDMADTGLEIEQSASDFIDADGNEIDDDDDDDKDDGDEDDDDETDDDKDDDKDDDS